jgi:hypothetical protein
VGRSKDQATENGKTIFAETFVMSDEGQNEEAKRKIN